MTQAQMWHAIQELDPGAQVRSEPPAGWSVRLPAIVYDPKAGRVVTSARASSGAQAIERLWARLLSLSEASTLWRRVEAAEGTRYEAVRWNGTEWITLRP
jgi:hypothetical protein